MFIFLLLFSPPPSSLACIIKQNPTNSNQNMHRLTVSYFVITKKMDFFCLCICMYFSSCVYLCLPSISKTEEYFDDHGVDIDLSQFQLVFFLLSCLYGVSITITITTVFLFRSFFLTLKKNAHVRQKQNKVNIFSTMKQAFLLNINQLSRKTCFKKKKGLVGVNFY